MEAAAAYGGNLSDFFIYKCIPGYGDPVLRAHGLVQWMGDGFVCLPGSSARMVCGACVCRLCAETACQEYLFHKAAVFPAVVPCGCFASCGGKRLLSCFYKRNLFKRLPVWQGAGSSFFCSIFSYMGSSRQLFAGCFFEGWLWAPFKTLPVKRRVCCCLPFFTRQYLVYQKFLRLEACTGGACCFLQDLYPGQRCQPLHVPAGAFGIR